MDKELKNNDRVIIYGTVIKSPGISVDITGICFPYIFVYDSNKKPKYTKYTYIRRIDEKSALIKDKAGELYATDYLNLTLDIVYYREEILKELLD